ncbi:MAG: hypothetical protein A3J79_10185 [Elusimicrobia bacterium RIFOXYB2_FULL_62_6]|nr:MAG: hypothetical protein A3J79_10185 [Elusimicrobia bacterium RIFOXYB2_FULL_62_6]
MDVLGRLRVLFWGLVISLWGLFMYQYISDDINMPRMKFSKNPLGTLPQDFKTVRKQYPPPPVRPPVFTGTQDVTGRTYTSGNMLQPLSKGLDIKEIPAGTGIMPEHSPDEKTAAGLIAERKEESYPPAPPGFAMQETRHFVVYEEGETVSQELANTVESLHGNIMLDLVAFSPWTREKRVFIFFTGNQDTYQRLTGRPAWSAGAASLSERKIYLFKSDEAMGILAHELTHIYFDSFFSGPVQSPLWLSEGIATYIQSERGLSTPTWLAQKLAAVEKGGGFKLSDLVRIDNMQGADEDNVRLWYAQSYSVVRFLMKLKAGDAFYQFCKRLKAGTPTHQALYQAYGMPYNKLSSLEYAWRYDLKTGKISDLNR